MVPHITNPKFNNSLCLVGGVGGSGQVDFPTFDAESNSTNIQNSLCPGDGGRFTFQLLILSPHLQKLKIPCVWWEGGSMLPFQLLMVSPNLQKSKIPYVWWRGGGGQVDFPTFDTESKSTTIQNSLSWNFCWKFSKFLDKTKSMVSQIALSSYNWSLVHYHYYVPSFLIVSVFVNSTVESHLYNETGMKHFVSHVLLWYNNERQVSVVDADKMVCILCKLSLWLQLSTHYLCVGNEIKYADATQSFIQLNFVETFRDRMWHTMHAKAASVRNPASWLH